MSPSSVTCRAASSSEVQARSISVSISALEMTSGGEMIMRSPTWRITRLLAKHRSRVIRPAVPASAAKGARAAVCRPVPPEADHLAVVGENRRMVVFPLGELSELAKGRGVILQRYRDGGLTDAKPFRYADGLSWPAGKGRRRTESDLRAWLSRRGGQGRMVPSGFPKSNRFGD